MIKRDWTFNSISFPMQTHLCIWITGFSDGWKSHGRLAAVFVFPSSPSSPSNQPDISKVFSSFKFGNIYSPGDAIQSFHNLQELLQSGPVHWYLTTSWSVGLGRLSSLPLSGPRLRGLDLSERFYQTSSLCVKITICPVRSETSKGEHWVFGSRKQRAKGVWAIKFQYYPILDVPSPGRKNQVCNDCNGVSWNAEPSIAPGVSKFHGKVIFIIRQGQLILSKTRYFHSINLYCPADEACVSFHTYFGWTW